MATPGPPLPATITPPLFISTATLSSILTHKSLISHLEASLPSATLSLTTPLRHSHQTSPSSLLLLMPSWSSSPSLPYSGVKIVSHHSLNSSLSPPLPSVHASFVLSSSLSGLPLALLDASLLTLLRTSSLSAVASLHLSLPSSQTLLVLGSGNLAPHLIRAHLVSRPNLSKILIWNHRPHRATALAQTLSPDPDFANIQVSSCDHLESAVREADIVSCATNSEVGLVQGRWLKEGAHLDLVGSFTPKMRECDDEAIRRGRVFVDCEAAVEEAGELVGAFERGVIGRDGVVGNLVEVISGEKVGRRDEREITVFKSVGSAVVDILAAQLVYETYVRMVNNGEQVV